MNLIRAEKLKINYGEVAVVNNLSFEINEQDFICIVGPNGSGKTTLIKCLLGLVRPFSGKITFNHLSPKDIGYMPQETSVDPHFPASVFEIVLSGSLGNSRNFYDQGTKQRAEETLKLLKIESLKTRCFSELSGGQRQKVLLARALMATKKLLILDEPSNNLDQKSKRALFKILETLNRKQKIAVAMITHDLDHNNLIGDKILSLREDDYFFGPTDEFIRKVHHE